MPLSSSELQRQLAGQEWTAHNIRLTTELTTMPGRPDFLETDLRLKAILRVLECFYRGKLANARAADLGCLEGGFALALAQRGMNVVGIEARERNIEKARLLKQHFDLPNLELVKGDVKNFSRENFGDFDVVLALGILYHLDQPTEWLRQIAGATRNLLIVDSHFAPADQASLALIDPRIAQLSALERIDDQGRSYEGRWFFEYGEGVDREGEVWSAYSNRKSFWLTKESLLRALLDAGFDLVFEQHDYSADSYNHFAIEFPRVIVVAVKSATLVQP